MKRFKNILYYADGAVEECPAFQRALALARSNHARLTLFDVISADAIVNGTAQHRNRASTWFNGYTISGMRSWRPLRSLTASPIHSSMYRWSRGKALSRLSVRYSAIVTTW